ncbi:MAG: hypothetical protein ACLGXA_08005 [Acidobacteriota bacterium]
MDFGFPVIAEKEMARLDSIADIGTQFTDQQAELRNFHDVPVTPFEQWAFRLGIRETRHMLQQDAHE